MITSKTPIFSVVMGVYKEPISWIVQSISSILNQTFQDFEFIIVNDNPDNPELLKCLLKYKEKDSRVTLILNDENIGLTKSLNKALDQARGKYIARMDADDVCNKKRLMLQYKYMEKNQDVDLCGSWGRSFGNISKLSLKIRKMPISDEEIKACLLFTNPFLHPSVCFKRVIKNKEVRYNENAKRSQDYMLWYELYLMGATFHNINIPLIEYRISNNQISVNYTSEQISVSGPIRVSMLKKINPMVSEKDSFLHLNICTVNSNEASFDEKISYLNNLNEWCKNEKNYSIYRKYCVKYAIAMCLSYNKLAYVNKISYIKTTDLMNWRIIRAFIKSLFN